MKPVIVFVHEKIRFEIWLAAVNKQAQTKYWKLFKESGWDKYHLVPTPQGVDSIIESVLVENPDFSNLDILTKQIERKTLEFITDIEDFLSTYKN